MAQCDIGLGMISHTCCRCLRPLKDPMSIRIGYGPTCERRRFGGIIRRQRRYQPSNTRQLELPFDPGVQR